MGNAQAQFRLKDGRHCIPTDSELQVIMSRQEEWRPLLTGTHGMDQNHSHVHPEAAGYEREAGGYRHDRHNPWAPGRYVIRRVIDPAHRTRKRNNREPGEKGGIRVGGKVAPVDLDPNPMGNDPRYTL